MYFSYYLYQILYYLNYWRGESKPKTNLEKNVEIVKKAQEDRNIKKAELSLKQREHLRKYNIDANCPTALQNKVESKYLQ
jgi:hypothetical protein